ncbi:hypothetical protein [Microbulbifer sp. TRSA007]|uniref:hypothetical protein n=1 Tax=Microbulbifer sp. TRSA007 TaxID=3243384 RepID=UPI004039559B
MCKRIGSNSSAAASDATKNNESRHRPNTSKKSTLSNAQIDAIDKNPTINRLVRDSKNLLKKMNDAPVEISSRMNSSRANTETEYLHTTRNELRADEVPTPIATTISESTFNKDHTPTAEIEENPLLYLPLAEKVELQKPSRPSPLTLREIELSPTNFIKSKTDLVYFLKSYYDEDSLLGKAWQLIHRSERIDTQWKIKDSLKFLKDFVRVLGVTRAEENIKLDDLIDEYCNRKTEAFTRNDSAGLDTLSKSLEAWKHHIVRKHSKYHHMSESYLSDSKRDKINTLTSEVCGYIKERKDGAPLTTQRETEFKQAVTSLFKEYAAFVKDIHKGVTNHEDKVIHSFAIKIFNGSVKQGDA